MQQNKKETPLASLLFDDVGKNQPRSGLLVSTAW